MSEAVQIQDPAETLDYAFDWTAWLVGDTIADSSWDIFPPGPLLTNPTFTPTGAGVYVAGVALGATYNLENTVITAAARTARRGLTIRGFPE